MLSSKQLDDLIRAWPDENGVSSDPETYAAWIRAQREHAGKFIGMALGKKRLESLTEEQSKQLYGVYQKLLGERIISEIGDDEIIAHYKIVTQKKGKDAKRKAIIRTSYVLSSSAFKIRKDVKFVGDTEFFNRNEYSLTR